MKRSLQSALLGLAILALVILGLAVVVTTMFWPSLVVFLLLAVSSRGAAVPITMTDRVPVFAATFGLVNLVHLYKLGTDAHHLAVYQFLWLPVRRLLVPVVMWVAKIESIREKAPTMYRKIMPSNDGDNDETIATMPRSVRRRYRKMEEFFRRSKIRHETVYCDESGMVLTQLLPILWEHERRACVSGDTAVLAEFIKRFLVVTLLPDGILDLYFSGHNLVAFQFSMRQGPPSVLHWFMYFCKDDYTRCGIWFHGIRLAIRRAHALTAETGGDAVWVNGQVHQTASKQNAGLVAADHTNSDLLSRLYPLTWSREIPREVAELKLWSSG